jgi:hypothetical protein
MSTGNFFYVHSAASARPLFFKIQYIHVHCIKLFKSGWYTNNSKKDTQITATLFSYDDIFHKKCFQNESF